MPVRRTSIAAVVALLAAGVSAWVSFGTLAVTASAVQSRVGILPSPLWLVLLILLALAVAFAARPQPAAIAIVALSCLTILPWLPIPLPVATLIWTGHLRLWLWLGIGATLAASAHAAPAPLLRAAADPRRAPWLAGAITVSVGLVGAWQVFPRLPAGDEPHYLIIAQSLLYDHDLKIENNHRQRDYRSYFRGDLPKPDYLRRGKDGEIYSVHAPGLPAIVAPAFALFGYPGVIVFLSLLAGAGTALAWLATWRVTHHVAASWFGWATVALSVPFFFQSFVVFPDGAGAVLVMFAFLTLVDEASVARLAAAGVALALLPWLHTRFSVLSAVLGVLIVVRQLPIGPRQARPLHLPVVVKRIAAFLVAPIVGAALWFYFFYAIYGTPNPTAPYGTYTQTSVTYIPRGLIGLIFDQQFGVLVNAPVYLCAALGIFSLAKIRARLALELLLVVITYACAATAYYMWWAGYSSPARFLVAAVLPLSIPAGAWFARASRGGRIAGVAALVVSVLITGALVFVDRGSLLFNVRQTAAASWLVWISPVVNLTTGLPSFFQNSPRIVLQHGCIWLIAIAMTWWFSVDVARRPLPGQVIALAVGAVGAMAAMVALDIVWQQNHAAPLTPTSGILALLRADSGSGFGVRYQPPQRIPIAGVAPSLTIAAIASPSTAAGPLLPLPRPPAGTYEITAVLGPSSAGHIMATTDRALPPQWVWDVAGMRGPWRQTIELPIAVPGLTIDADAAARRSLAAIAVRAERVVPRHQQVVDAEQIHAVRYGPAVLFATAGHAFVEAAGTWIAGGESGEFVVAPQNGSAMRLFVRNAPVANQVTIDNGGHTQTLNLQPREERLLDLAAGILRVTTSAGARPADVEPGNTDHRLLGCWIEVR